MKAGWEVLVIEDDQVDRDLVSEVLALRGRGRIKLTEARDLRSGLDLLARGGFDLVMLDTKLPEVTALYALRAIGEQAPQTPILTHTAYITVQIRRQARERGAFDTVVRGELNSMWAAAHRLLAPELADEPQAVAQALAG